MLGAIVLAILLPLHLSLMRYPFDDSFIHFRIARNFVLHGQPYFNLGEPILSTSSPLWTLVLTAVFQVCGFNVSVVAVLNAVLMAIGATLWISVAELVLDRRSAMLTAIIITSYIASVLVASVGLMETPLTMMLLGAGSLDLCKRRERAFLFFALGCFARPELGIVYLCAVVAALRHCNLGLKLILQYSAVAALPLAAFELTYFGTVIPQTISAKSIVYQLNTSETVTAIIAQLFGDDWLARARRGLAWLIVLLVALALKAVVTPRTILSDLKASKLLEIAWLAAGGGAILMAYLVRHIMPFSWYLPLFVWPLWFSLLLTAYATRDGAVRLASLAISLPLALRLAVNLYAGFVAPEYFQNFHAGARVRSYLAVATELEKEFPGRTLLSSEIGALGWKFQGPILDGCGLVTPRALAFHPMKVPQERDFPNVGAIPLGFVEESRPDLVVTMESFIKNWDKAPFSGEYIQRSAPIFLTDDLALDPHAELWGSKKIDIFIKKSS
jgi:hypothetical protein